MLFDAFLDHIEAEAGTRDAVFDRRLGAIEAFEQIWHRFGRNTDPVIFHFALQPAIFLPRFDAQRALAGKFDPVVD